MALRPTSILRATHAYTPMIKFLGKRNFPPASESAGGEHEARPHPMSPDGKIPSSFQEYRKQAQTHGPLGSNNNNGTANGAGQGSVIFSRSQLPPQYHYIAMSAEEAEAIESGGASFVY